MVGGRVFRSSFPLHPWASRSLLPFYDDVPHSGWPWTWGSITANPLAVWCLCVLCDKSYARTLMEPAIADGPRNHVTAANV